MNGIYRLILLFFASQIGIYRLIYRLILLFFASRIGIYRLIYRLILLFFASRIGIYRLIPRVCDGFPSHCPIDIHFDCKASIFKRKVLEAIFSEDLVDAAQTASPFLDEAHVVESLDQHVIADFGIAR